MSITIPDLVRTNFWPSTISAVVGAVIAYVASKLLGKTKRLRFSTNVERLALTADDPIFGSIRVTWGNNQVRNLFMARVEVENCSNHDFENVELKVYTGNETFLFSERSSVVNSPYIIPWTPEYKAILVVPAGGTPTPAQWNTYNHSRDYLVPVFNRGQLLQFSYLCSRPADDLVPGVFVSTQLKGAKLEQHVRAGFVLGVPLQTVIVRWVILSVFTVVACGFFLHKVWVGSLICMLVGLFAQYLGALMYKAERGIWNLFAG